MAACIVLAVAGLAIGTVVYLENSQRKNDKRILAQSNVIERLDAELKKVEQKSKKEIEEVMNRVEVQRQQQKSAKTNNTQEDENPPVTGPGAYVQTFDCDYVSEGSGILDGFYYDIKAQVKIVRSGTYTVRAGFWKNNKFLVGEISGGNYFRDRIVSGETGDMIPVAIRIANIRPLFCRTMNCQVVDQ